MMKFRNVSLVFLALLILIVVVGCCPTGGKPGEFVYKAEVVKVESSATFNLDSTSVWSLDPVQSGWQEECDPQPPELADGVWVTERISFTTRVLFKIAQFGETSEHVYEYKYDPDGCSGFAAGDKYMVELYTELGSGLCEDVYKITRIDE